MELREYNVPTLLEVFEVQSSWTECISLKSNWNKYF